VGKAIDFCLNVYLQRQAGAEAVSESPFGHLCYLAGPYRLIILWHRTGDDVLVSAQTHRRDEIVGGGSTGTSLTIPGAAGASTYSIDAPFLSLGAKTLVADFGYTAAAPGEGRDPDEIDHTRLKIFVELRPNPHAEQSAGGRHVD
jgi:hypothetical protein